MTYFLKIENIRKQVHWNRRFEASAFTFYWGFKKKKNTLRSRFTKWCKVYTKTDSWFQKSHGEFGKLLISSGKSKKLKFDGCFCPKNTRLQKKRFVKLKHYIHRIYLTLLSTTCVKIHQVTHVIFETISHFSRHNFSVFL